VRVTWAVHSDLCSIKLYEHSFLPVHANACLLERSNAILYNIVMHTILLAHSTEL